MDGYLVYICLRVLNDRWRSQVHHMNIYVTSCMMMTKSRNFIPLL